jgi:hypothetical protein
MPILPRIQKGEGYVRSESGREWRIPPPKPAPSKKPSAYDKRTDYHNYLKQKYGLPEERPFKSYDDIRLEVNDITQQEERLLFEGFFGDYARYEDRGQLDKKAQSAWRGELLQARKKIENKVTEELKSQQEQYDQLRSFIKEELRSYDAYHKSLAPKEKKPKEIKPPYYGKEVDKAQARIDKWEKDGTPITDSRINALEAILENTLYKPEYVVTEEGGLFGKEEGRLEIVPRAPDWLSPDKPAKGITPQQERQVVRRGTHNGRPVVQYSDGSIEYAD